MSLLNLQLNPAATNAVLKVGAEKTPVIVIDDFMVDANSVVDYVSQTIDFDAEQRTFYPGFRARINSDYTRVVVNALGKHLFKVFSIPDNYKLILDGAYYSLVATPPEELLPAQCRPHADTALPYYLAIMHYLSPDEHGGTGFFKHKPTGFEKITPNRIDEYKESMLAFFDAHGHSQPGYITQSSEQYELMGEIGYKPNRMIIYPGCLLHSGLINPATDISKDPRTGRLTANIFLNFTA